MQLTDQQRFASKIIKGPAETDCWIWTGAIGDDGYGRFWTRHKDGGQCMLRAHRYALAQALGGEGALPQSVEVCHSCDNPLCVRAEDGGRSHLHLGDRAQNMQERAARGRGNTQLAAQLFRPQTRAERAKTSRALRSYVLTQGYDAEAISTILGKTTTGQRPLW